MIIIMSKLNRLKKSTERFRGKFAVKCVLKIPPRLAYVATLLCETLISGKQALSDKLQRSVAAYFRCTGVVNNQINKGLLLSLLLKKNKIGEYFASYKQERDCLVHFLRLSAVC